VARGDVETVRGHVVALANVMPEMLALYKELGRHAVAVGRAKGTLGSEDANKLMDIFNQS